MSVETIKNSIRNIPDFPKIGIQFKDITTALQNAEVLRMMLDNLAAHYKNEKIDYIIGIEARGFIFGAPLAYLLNCGFVPIRKPGKLPAEVISEEYDLEYGSNKLEMHKDAFKAGARVLIVDDLLATAGTAEAAAKLATKLGAYICGFAFIIELSDLGGRNKLRQYAPVYSIVQY